MKYVSLEEWARQRFGSPPCSATLRRWARGEKIVPRPTRPGREWMVREDARLLGDEPRMSLVERLASGG